MTFLYCYFVHVFCFGRFIKFKPTKKRYFPNRIQMNFQFTYFEKAMYPNHVCFMSLISLSTISWRRSGSLIRPDSIIVWAEKENDAHSSLLYSFKLIGEIRGKAVVKDRTCILRNRVNEITVKVNYNSRIPWPERLSWDKIYKRFLAFLIIESMWQFHFRPRETLRHWKLIQ